MPPAQLTAVLRHVHDLAAENTEWTDAELLRRFREHHDEAAFGTLVRRHGRLVLGVCQRVLRQREDAEDAFQATFLVLARKAASVRQGAALPSWLYGVAYHIACKARRAANRRQARERKASKGPYAKPDLELAWRELQAVLAEEVQRLPAKWRAPFVLCCLEGRSKAEAAAQLGWKEGTVSGRLAQARQRMQQRLTRRGLTLSAVLCAGSLAAGEALALAPALVQRTVQGVLGCAAGQAAAVPAPVAALAKGVTNTMLANQMKVVTLLTLTLGLLSAGAGVWLHRTFANPVPPPTKPAAEVKPADQPPAAQAVDEAGAVFTYSGRVLGPDGRPLAGANVLISGLTPGVIEFRRRVVSGPDGTFRFRVRRDEFGDHGKVPPGRSPPERYVEIGATAEGCGAAMAWAGKAKERENLTLWLPAEEVVQGRVVNLEGQPVAGVQVQAYIRAARWDADHKPQPFDGPEQPGQLSINTLPFDKDRNLAVTDKDGRFTLRGLGRGWLYQLYFSGPTIVHTKAELVARPDPPKKVGATGVWTPEKGDPRITRYGSDFTFVATPCRPIVGVVREKGTGKPVEGAEVRNPFRRDDEATASTKTDKDGKYRLVGLPAGVHTLNVYPPRNSPYVPIEAPVSADRPGIEPVAFDIALERQPAVTGRVTDRVTGKPVKGWVEYRPLAGNPNLKANPYLAEAGLWKHLPATETNEDGRFMVPVLRGRGVLLVRAERDYRPARLQEADRVAGVADPADPELIDCRPLPAWPREVHAYHLIDVPEGKDAEVAIALTPGITRALRVEFPGGTARDATVLGLKPAERDQGEALYSAESTIAALGTDEARRLFLATYDGQFAAATVVRGAETGPVMVELQPTGTVTGRVVDKDRHPIPDVSFQMLFDDGPGRPGVFVHSGSCFRLRTPAESKRGMRTQGFGPDKFEYASTSEKTDAQGRFRVPGVLPDVPFDLKVVLVAPPNEKGQRVITAMVKIARPTVKPGDTLDLGDLRAVAPPPK